MTDLPTIAPFGTWRSPITAEVVARTGVRLTAPSIDGDDIYWLERRPEEGGRYVLVRRNGAGQVEDVTPAGTNVRSRVHEYAGGACVVSRGVVYFSEYADQRVYRLRPGGGPVPITPAGPWRYADAAVHPSQEWMACVREDHTAAGREPTNTIVALAADGPEGPGDVLTAGFDFYGCPRFSPDGSRLSWIAWRHPQMPWDGTELWTAPVTGPRQLGPARRVAGGNHESIFQPGWSPDGVLGFVSDRSSWWNLYREGAGRIVAVCPMAAEFGRPMWQFGMATWAWPDAQRIVAACCRQGQWTLVTIDVPTGQASDLTTAVSPGEQVVATGTHAVCVGESPAQPDAIVRIDLGTGAVEQVRTAASFVVDRRYLSRPESIAFPTSGDDTAYARYYPPSNSDVAAPAGERPPLMVVSHGGPTAAASSSLDLGYQFWTSRGFAVVDVDYRGSTGYGRAYREKINGQWGIVDVEDCINAARYLVDRGDVDPDRLVIRGASAGGYTTLAALAFHPDVFGAGASYYGVSDLEALTRDTHKFEARYLDSLLGPYPAMREVYRARSPIHAVDRLSCPLILLQGLEDMVVPPSQARTMADAVRAKGLPVAILLFDGEQHGFRRSATIRRCLESELAFYGVVFGFDPADELPPVVIENRPGRS